MRAVWFLGGVAFRGFRARPLGFLIAVAVFLWVVMGVSEPWDATQDRQPQVEQNGDR